MKPRNHLNYLGFYSGINPFKMSTEKKLTPLQEAIAKLEKLSGQKTVISLLKSLLPKEKEFAREMWDMATEFFSETANDDKKLNFFDNYYQQYES